LKKESNIEDALNEEKRTQQQREGCHAQGRVRHQVTAKQDIGDPHEQFPKQTSSAMGLKSQDEMDDTRQNDEPRKDCVHGHSRKGWRANCQDPKHNEQNAAQD